MFSWVCHAYCQMTNHYHAVVETPDANLSKGMRQLNGVYTQRFNRSHGRAHPRDKAIALAYLSGQHTMAAIADHFGIHYTTVSRLVKAYETDQR